MTFSPKKPLSIASGSGKLAIRSGKLLTPLQTFKLGAYKGNGQNGLHSMPVWEDFIGHKCVLAMDALASPYANGWTGTDQRSDFIMSNAGSTLYAWTGTGYDMVFQLPMLPQDGTTFLGYISGTTLHITTAPTGAPGQTDPTGNGLGGQYIYGIGPAAQQLYGTSAYPVAPGTIVLAQAGSVPGGVGAYPINISQNVGSSANPVVFGVKSTLALGAAGDYNSFYTAIAQQIVANGFPSCVIRLGWEFNGGYYPWAAAQDPTSWTAYWRQIVTTMRAVPGANFLFDYNPTLGTNQISPYGVLYPGDGYVDILGQDIYDKTYNGTTPALAWANSLTQADGINAWIAFGNAHSKFLSVPEFGVGADFSGGNFVGYIDNGAGGSGTVLHYVSGTAPAVGMCLTGPGVTQFTVVTGGSGSTFTVNLPSHAGSSGSNITINACFSFGDDPSAVSNMYNLIAANPLTATGGFLYLGLWDYNTSTDFSGQLSGATTFPNTAAEFLATFAASPPPNTPPAPGAVTTLAATAIITPTTLSLAWAAPATGGPVGKYSYRYRITGSGAAWSIGGFLGPKVTTLGIGGLGAGTEYDFQIEALNNGGLSGYSSILNVTTLPSTYPGQVQYLGVSSAGYNSVVLGWSAPADGTAPTGYTVQYRTHGSGSWTTASVTSSTAATVSGLSPSTNYDFQVFATTNSGAYAGPSEQVTQATIAQPTTIPPGPVPYLGNGGTITNSAVPLSWSVPTSGGPVGGYTVQYRVTGSTPWTGSQGFAYNSGTVTGLTASTSYDFQVYASNAFGNGSPSGVYTASTIAGLALPGPVPYLGGGGTITNSAVPLSWTAPSSGGAVASYTVQYRVTGSGTWITFGSVAYTADTVTGLTSGTSYDFQVAAVNATGTGAYSGVYTASTSSSVSPPGNIPYLGDSLGSAGSAVVNLSWTAPTSGGAVTGYQVQYRLHGTSTWTTINYNGGTGTPYTNASTFGLTSGTVYDFQVYAYNSGGNGGPYAIGPVTAP